MQFKINKDTDFGLLAMDMVSEITKALKSTLTEQIYPPKSEFIVDIFINIRTTNLNEQ